ncbi:MAG: hypothetical protein L3K00_03815 [Thermoplasmata archaeon]|nr:hypothetical protein [Thermoplasmata archaeon]MCI4361760.1 hypothetical protein [Thermoplasmata archaeon]
MPAVVGGGWGDIAEVLDAGRTLASAGYPVALYRAPGRPLPPAVEGPWDWTEIERRSVLSPSAPSALTVSPNWGVSAAPDRPGRLGRGGVWSVEAAAIEREYGPTRTLHVSLEEFARTLPSREENAERWREGGTPAKTIRTLRRGAPFRRDTTEFHDAFRTFRAFDRPNLLHLFQGFAPTPGFSREFPEAVQVGPLWPFPAPPAGRLRTPRGRWEWVWYASPSSSPRLVSAVDRGLAGSGVRRVGVRSPRTISVPSDGTVAWSVDAPARSGDWERRFRSAELRIVTGSRTLLEALRVGGPFLYFNGVLGTGGRTHRHRPEKIRALLSVWKSDGVSLRLRRDLDSFSAARRVEEVVRAAATDPTWSADFPERWGPSGYPPDRSDAGGFLVRVAHAFAAGSETSADLVGALRSGRRLPG